MECVKKDYKVNYHAYISLIISHFSSISGLSVVNGGACLEFLLNFASEMSESGQEVAPVAAAGPEGTVTGPEGQNQANVSPRKAKNKSTCNDVYICM